MFPLSSHGHSWMQGLILDSACRAELCAANEKATARELPRATDVNAITAPGRKTAPGWKTKDKEMKSKADEPSSVLALVVHFH